jgi:hypothetical protein
MEILFDGTQQQTHNEHSKQQKNPQEPTLKPETHKEHLTLQNLSLSFPTPRGHARIAVVDGAFQIQHLSPPFNLDVFHQ